MGLDESRRCVQAMRREGLSEEDIVGFLTAAGWVESDIDRLTSVDEPLAPAPPAEPASGRVCGGPQLRTLALVWVWLGLTGPALIYSRWQCWGTWSKAFPVQMLVFAVILGGLAVLGWLVPVAVAAVGLHQGRPYSWWVLMVCACLWCLLWTLVTAFGGYWGIREERAVALVMLVFSGLTVWSLLRDPPDRWTRTAS